MPPMATGEKDHRNYGQKITETMNRRSQKRVTIQPTRRMLEISRSSNPNLKPNLYVTHFDCKFPTDNAPFSICFLPIDYLVSTMCVTLQQLVIYSTMYVTLQQLVIYSTMYDQYSTMFSND